MNFKYINANKISIAGFFYNNSRVVKGRYYLREMLDEAIDNLSMYSDDPAPKSRSLNKSLLL